MGLLQSPLVVLALGRAAQVVFKLIEWEDRLLEDQVRHKLIEFIGSQGSSHDEGHHQ